MKNINSTVKELEDRWDGKEDLIKKIIRLINQNDDSWTKLITNLKYVEEVENRKDLRGINLEGESFESSSLKNIDLRYSNLRKGNFCNSDLSTTDIRGANLEDIKVNNCTDWGTYFIQLKEFRKKTDKKPKYYFMQIFARNFGYKGKIFSEIVAKTKEDYRIVKEIYNNLRIAYQEENMAVSDYFHYREYCCQLKQYKWYNPALWLGKILEKSTCMFTAPLRTFFSGFALIMIFSLFYWLIPNGIVRENSFGDVVSIKNLGEAFYFSIVTFTSLGYGDFHPNLDSSSGQFIKYICNLEAILGILSLAILAALTFRFITKR